MKLYFLPRLKPWAMFELETGIENLMRQVEQIFSQIKFVDIFVF